MGSVPRTTAYISDKNSLAIRLELPYEGESVISYSTDLQPKDGGKCGCGMFIARVQTLQAVKCAYHTVEAGKDAPLLSWISRLGSSVMFLHHGLSISARRKRHLVVDTDRLSWNEPCGECWDYVPTWLRSTRQS